MADAIQSSFWHRIRYTPLRDVIHGQLTARLDWRGRLAAAELPKPAYQLVERGARRTRLWRIEKSAVVDELAAHFRDALDAGKPVEKIVESFGNERQTAKLIRRAKLRKRPLVWQAWRWLGRSSAGLAAILAAVYVPTALLFYCSHPGAPVDYVAQINAPILAVPEADRAWPTYRRVILDLVDRQKMARDGLYAALPLWISRNIDGPHWPEMAAWVNGHREDVEALRAASVNPAVGFVLGLDGSSDDLELFTPSARHAEQAPGPWPLLIDVDQLNQFHFEVICDILQADAKLAQFGHDKERLAADINAMLNLSDQLRRGPSFLINDDWVVLERSLDVIQRTLLVDPAALDDRQLAQISDRIAGPKTASDLSTTARDRMFFYDMVNHVYSDNGHGDGHVTLAILAGTDNLADDLHWGHESRNVDQIAAHVAGPAFMFICPGRAALLQQFDQLADAADVNFRLPVREQNWDAERRFFFAIESSLWTDFRYDLAGRFLLQWEAIASSDERYLGRRDGVMTAVVLERYRRQHGAYPQALQQLVPEFLSAIPADRFTGAPIKYRPKSGKPLLYSVGVDRVDDGGTPSTDWGRPNPTAAAPQPWNPAEQSQSPVYGDWILYPVLPTYAEDWKSP